MTAARYIVFTDNVERMVSFYRDRMKMTILMPPEAIDHDPEGWVRLVSGGVEVAIHCAGKPGCAGRNRNKLVFIVKDVGSAREELRKAGVRMGEHHFYPKSECCDFKDPDGNKLQISNR